MLIVARGLGPGGRTTVRSGQKIRLRRPAASTAEFPGYGRIFSDLSWAQVSWRHYVHPLRPTPDLAALDRIITSLES